MKMNFMPGFLLLAATVTLAEPVQTVRLDERTVITVPVATNRVRQPARN
jgi:hypothetical protein